MRFWILTVGEPVPVLDGAQPRLLRSALLARLLASRGHSVVWWTSSFDHYHKVQRTAGEACFRWEGVTIHLLHSVGYPKNVSLRRFAEHRGVARRFREWSGTEPRPDLILASFPTIELAGAGVTYARGAGIPVLVDVRDLWPDLLATVAPKPLRGLARVALQPMYSAARRALRGATGITAVSPGYMSWALGRAGRASGSGDGVFPLGYVQWSDGSRRPDALIPNTDGARPADHRTVAIYIGSFGRQYDLEPVIAAAREFQAVGRRDVEFVFVGDGEMGPRWREMSEGLRNVRFTGWMDRPEIERLLSTATLGLQPYAVEATQGLPNKLFEYLSAGLPVLSSLPGESERFLSEEGCGVTYRAEDASDFQAKLVGMLRDRDGLETMAEKARAAFAVELDAGAILERMADHVERVANGRR